MQPYCYFFYHLVRLTTHYVHETTRSWDRYQGIFHEIILGIYTSHNSHKQTSQRRPRPRSIAHEELISAQPPIMLHRRNRRHQPIIDRRNRRHETLVHRRSRRNRSRRILPRKPFRRTIRMRTLHLIRRPLTVLQLPHIRTRFHFATTVRPRRLVVSVRDFLGRNVCVIMRVAGDGCLDVFERLLVVAAAAVCG